MKKISLFLALAFCLGCVNFAFGQCTITGSFQNGRSVNNYLVNDHTINLTKGKKFYVEVNIKDVSGTGNYRPFRIYLQSNNNNADNPSMSDVGFPVLLGNLIGGSGGSYESRTTNNNYTESDWEKTRETSLPANYQRIRVIADIDGGFNVRGRYTIKIYSEGCNSNGSSGGSGSSSGSGNNSGGSDSKKPKETSNDDGSIDLGKVIMDRIRNRGSKPNNDSGGNNNQSSNNFGDGVTIFEGKNQGGKSSTFGVGTYRADYGPIKAIGNDTASSVIVENGYRVKICQNEGDNNQGSGNCEEYGAGNYNLKYDNQASWIKVWKDGNSGRNNESGSNNSATGCVFKENFTYKKGANAYVKDYPVSLGSGSYRIQFTQNLNRDKSHAGFRIGLFNKNTDPTGERILNYYGGGLNVYSREIKGEWFADGENGQKNSYYSYGEFGTSQPFTNKNFTTLRISFWQGVGLGQDLPGSYEIRIIGGSCNASTNGNSGGNNNSTSPPAPPVNNNPPATSQGSRTIKLFFYKPKKGDTRCATNLVSVNRQISSSQSVLRESLNALFGDDDSGMDDYTTGLSLVNLTITNGVANIVVTGSQNSACASLFDEQVRKTAMQFPTVKDVNIQFQK